MTNSSIYIFDTNSISELGSFNPNVFGSMWGYLNKLVKEGSILSTEQVSVELEKLGGRKKCVVGNWIESNNKIFMDPDERIMSFVHIMFKEKEFQNLVKRENILKGSPVADPFVIATAKVLNATVVTEETFKENTIRIPNICKYYGIPCINLSQLMEEEGWKF